MEKIIMVRSGNETGTRPKGQPEPQLDDDLAIMDGVRGAAVLLITIKQLEA